MDIVITLDFWDKLTRFSRHFRIYPWEFASDARLLESSWNGICRREFADLQSKLKWYRSALKSCFPITFISAFFVCKNITIFSFGLTFDTSKAKRFPNSRCCGNNGNNKLWTKIVWSSFYLPFKHTKRRIIARLKINSLNFFNKISSQRQ